jgi:hypothetical protein
MYSVEEIARWELGRNGLCVVVEGQTPADDPYFFNQWFGGRYPRITFYHQNGYTKVVEAVTELRTKLTLTPMGKPRVYGITDRDFREPFPEGDMPPDGVLCMTKCMLENYFLDSQAWSAYLWTTIHRKTLRQELDIHLWANQEITAQHFQAKIEELYRLNLEVAAYNWTLFKIKQRFQPPHPLFPGNFPADLDFPEQYTSQRLADFARISGLDLTEITHIFTTRHTFLQQQDIDALANYVQGKALYSQFFHKYLLSELRIRGKDKHDAAAEALKYSSLPPRDLERLVSFIEHYALIPNESTT